MPKKEQKDLAELKDMYAFYDEMKKGGIRKCPFCKSKSWWQVWTQGRQCNKCWKLF